MAFESFFVRYLRRSFQIFAGPVGFIGADILVVYVVGCCRYIKGCFCSFIYLERISSRAESAIRFYLAFKPSCSFP